MTDNKKIEIFKTADGDVTLEIKLEQETLWLTQLQMSELFDTTSENVLMHLRNIYKEQALMPDRTTKDFLVVRQEGKRRVRRSLKHYSLDAIIFVGYRVSSTRATQFRIWATTILNQHLVQGYTLNQKRLQERGVEFEQALELLSQTLKNHQCEKANVDFFFKQWGAWGKNGIKRSKKANGRKLQGKTWDMIPVVAL